jgi:hypothetical protein
MRNNLHEDDTELKYEDDYYKILELTNTYNEDCTLKELLEDLKKNPLGYKCPKCNDIGKYSVSVNAYPSGLPDSGWAFEQGWKDVTCDICNGHGFNKFKVIEQITIIGPRREVTGYCTEDGTKTWNLKEKGAEPF